MFFSMLLAPASLIIKFTNLNYFTTINTPYEWWERDGE